MIVDLDEQEDELLALLSILGPDEFVRHEPKFAGEIRVSAELPADFSVVLREGEILSQYELSFLPPLLLTFELPENYPSTSPPAFTLTCSWLTHTQLSELGGHLLDVHQSTGGAVVLFSWVQFLKEDALRFLGIDSLLELPSDLSAVYNSRHTQNTELCEPTIHHHQIAASAASEGDVDSLGAQKNATSCLGGQKDTTADRCDIPPPGHSDQRPTSASTPSHSDVHRAAPSLTTARSLLSQLLVYNTTQQQKVFSSTVFYCSVCFVGQLGSECVQLQECRHVFCQACLTEFCRLQINEGNVRGVTCPQADCTASPTPAQVKSLVGEELFSRYDRLLLQSTLDCMSDVVYCPRPSCGSAVIQEQASRAALCTGCGFAFCVSCRKTYHGVGDCVTQMTWNDTQAQESHAALPQTPEGIRALWDDYNRGSQQRKGLLESRYGRQRMQMAIENCLSEVWVASNSKNCPFCFSRIEKNGGCNMMTCTQCRQVFCWACLEKLPPGGHFHLGVCSFYS